MWVARLSPSTLRVLTSPAKARERCAIGDTKRDFLAGFLQRHGVRQHHVLAGEEIRRVAGVAADRTHIVPHDGTSESR